ncbi:LysE family translocator [Actinomadura rupiterrae]|uniref:LysE family translocator n=1 Tax=Actinomadura rupiterrae TaxID=559627 RepID=UPI0020A3FD5B|nr:LysE family translocator [Actinomadura rupiterrae]MCP2343669.1 threonine/homoserine/homoserine lactone efflux protein [Actinomadura rupiterrae]
MLLAYLGICLLITVTPGLDTAVVIRGTLKGGARAGLRTAAGCALGLFVHATGVAVGLAGVLLRSAVAFEAVKLAGAAFLVYLGARTLWAVRHGRADEQDDDAPARFARFRSPFVQGLLTNLTNPKATLVFLATLPQFVPSGHPAQAVPVALGLALIAVLFSLSGLSLVAVAVGRVRHLLASPRVRRVQEAVLGGTLVGLGLRVAAE